MTSKSLPGVRRHPKKEAQASRLSRATEIVRESAREIAESAEGAVFHVPSSFGGYYVVSLSRWVCECADFEHRGAPCKHLLAAEITRRKSACCADCNVRSLRCDLVEVTEDHDSLTWFVGDELCRPCALGHGLL